MTVLQDVRETMSQAEQECDSLEAQIAKLRAENARLKARASARLRCKISEKGAVSVYGMGRWPVTLYASQWRALLGFASEIEAFLVDNSGSLSEKGE